MSSCMVCMEKFDDLRKNGPKSKVHCSFCHSQSSEHSSCVSCLKTYLCQHAEFPLWHCMVCKKHFTTSFIIEIFPPSTVNVGFKALQKKLLLEQQISMLPSTDHAVEMEKGKREALRKTRKIETEIRKRKLEIRDFEYELSNVGYMTRTQTHRISTPISMKCDQEGCRGFLNDDGENLKCNVCDGISCKRCFVKKLPNPADSMNLQHYVRGEFSQDCDPETLATMKELKKKTKQCPNQTCGALISKIEGCDQMFCVICKKSFSWGSGQPVVTGHLHNPHYLEWMRTREDETSLQRDIADIPCGGMPTINDYHRLILSLPHLKQEKDKDYLILKTGTYQVITNMTHNLHVESPRCQTNEGGSDAKNTHNRVLYLLNELSEEELAERTHQMFKKQLKVEEFLDVMVMVNETISDVLRRLIHELRFSKTLEEFVTISKNAFVEFASLQNYANEMFKKIGTSFKSTFPRYALYFWFYRSARVKFEESWALVDDKMYESAHINNTLVGERRRGNIWRSTHQKMPDIYVPKRTPAVETVAALESEGSV
jgi:hypothetical protein